MKHPGLDRGFPTPEPGAERRLAMRPLGMIAGDAAEAAVAGGFARVLAGGPLAFTACEVLVEAEGRLHSAVAPLPRLLDWADRAPAAAAAVGDRLARLSAPRPPFAGVPVDRPRVIGIVNATPDSFSDGGDFADAAAATAHGEALIEAGADIIDVGGESTRPGAEPTPEEVELERVLPVVRGLAGRGVPLSIDTRRPAVMRAALAAGATVINDVSALSGAGALEAAKDGAASVILMHMRGEPATMQDNPVYDHAPYEIWRYLGDRVAACERAGLPARRIAVDPGIGFGKTAGDNMRILAEIALFHGVGCVVALGASRKISAGAKPKDRLPATLAATLATASQAVQLHRVHDVAEVRQALAVLARLHGGGAGRGAPVA